MAIIAGTDIDWTVSPRIVKVPASETSVTVEDMQDTLLDLEYNETGIVFPFTRSTSGGEDLGGGVTVGLTTELQNTQISFGRTSVIETGTATTATTTINGRIRLLDTSATFQTNLVKRGDWVINFTDQSCTEIIEVVSETEVVCNPLTQGATNVFNLNDAYKVWQVEEAQLEGGNFVAVDPADQPINPVFPTFGRFISKASASSSTTQNQAQLEYATFNGYVSVDTVNGVSGTEYPIGTPQNPVDNLPQALEIAVGRGFKELLFASDFTFATTDVLDDFIVRGRSFTKTFIVLTPDALITNCKFLDCDVDGQLDGGNELVNCRIENLNYIDGALIDCELEQTITLSGVQADLIRCYSGVAGGGAGQTPTIDMNGGGTNLVVRDYQGGIKIANDTMGADNVSIDMSSGRVILDTTITAGVYTLRGMATLEDNSSGTAVVNDQLLDPIYFRQRLTNIDEVVKHIEQYVFVDTELLVNGDGSARSPYNNVTDAKDYAEANGIFQIITYSEITIDRTLKNFNIIGIGQPVIDMNNQSIDKSRFSYCTLRGQYTGSIVAQACVLDNGFYLNGFFENCGANGTLTCQDGGDVLLKNCASIIAGLNRPTISMNGTGSSNLAIRDWQGGLTITDCNNALDNITVEIMGGSLTFDATCTAGTMVARGLGKFVDNSNGATVIDETAFSVLPEDSKNVLLGTTSFP